MQGGVGAPGAAGAAVNMTSYFYFSFISVGYSELLVLEDIWNKPPKIANNPRLSSVAV